MAITRKQGLKRLEALADFLDALPKERFNFAEWVGSDWQGAPDLSCGTTACALGWATTMPKFRRLGLHMRPGGVPYLVAGFYFVGISAAQKLFALSDTESQHLFLPTSFMPYDMDENIGFCRENATAKDVAAMYRRFIDFESR